MTNAQLIVAFLGSAAVGALVSSIINAVAQWRERQARQRELLLSKAIDMAQKTTELLYKVSSNMGGGAAFTLRS